MHDHPLEAAIDHLVATIKSEEHPEPLALWAVAALAARLDLVAVAAPEDDAVATVGEAWADIVVGHLRRRPEDREAVLGVVYEVVQRVVDKVRPGEGAVDRHPRPT